MSKPADVEEARRRLAQHPRKGDPTAMPGETLDEKAARLRAEQADDRVRLVLQSDGTVLIRLPYVDYLDTQAGPVELGLDDGLLRELHEALSHHLAASENESHQVVGGWGVNYAPSAAAARSKVSRLLAAHPECGARAEKRIERAFDDGAEYIGPWLPLDDPAGPVPAAG